MVDVERRQTNSAFEHFHNGQDVKQQARNGVIRDLKRCEKRADTKQRCQVRDATEKRCEKRTDPEQRCQESKQLSTTRGVQQTTADNDNNGQQPYLFRL